MEPYYVGLVVIARSIDYLAIVTTTKLLEFQGRVGLSARCSRGIQRERMFGRVGYAVAILIEPTLPSVSGRVGSLVTRSLTVKPRQGRIVCQPSWPTLPLNTATARYTFWS